MFAHAGRRALVSLTFAQHPIRVLGVDPGLTRCGIGVVDGAPGRALRLVRVGVIRTSADDDIATRLLEEPHTPREIGELLIAFELTTEQLRGNSDVIDGKLYEIADRLKGEQVEEAEQRRE